MLENPSKTILHHALPRSDEVVGERAHTAQAFCDRAEKGCRSLAEPAGPLWSDTGDVQMSCRCISAPADASVTLCRTLSLPLCRPTSTNTSEDACATSLPVHGQLPGHCMPATLQSLMASPSAGSSVSYPGPPRNNPFQDDDGIVHIVAPEAPADDADMQTAGDGASMPKNDLFSPGQEDGSEVSFAQLLSELASQSAEANELARRGRSFETVRGPGASAAAVGAEPKPLPSHDFVHSGYATSDTSTMAFRTATTASVGASGALRHPCGTRSTSSASVHHSDSRSFHHKAAKGWPQRLAVPPCESPTSPLAAAPDGYFGNLKAPSLPHRSSTISTGNDSGGRRRHLNPRLMRALSSNDYETQLKWSN